MYQSIHLLGRVGNDAELRFTPSGSAVASFSLATSETWNSNGEKQERTTWHRCTLWGKAAESLAEHVTKGKMLFVDGTVSARAWTDKDGKPQASLEVKVNQLRFAGGRSDNGHTNGSVDNVSVDSSESIPF